MRCSFTVSLKTWKNVFNICLNRWKLMSAYCGSAGRLFHSFRPAAAKHHSCCRSIYNTRPWCGRTQLTTTFVDCLSQRPDRLEPCRPVTGRRGWPSWNPPDVEPEASALAPCNQQTIVWAVLTVLLHCVTTHYSSLYYSSLDDMCIIFWDFGSPKACSSWNEL